MKPLVTALVDTYNHESYIEQALISVLEQGLSPAELEIVVVDDGSTDRTPEIIQQFAPRVRYVRKKNGGQASALNAGFAEAQGEIVALLDADDYWLPGKLHRVIKGFEQHPEAGLVYHRLRDYDMQTGEQRDAPFEPVSGFVAESVTKVLLFGGVTTTSLAFRRSVVESLLPIPEELRIQADAYIATLSTFLAPVVAVEEALAVYRIHDGNLYFSAAGDMDLERMKRRIATRRALANGVRTWLKSRGYSLWEPPIRATVRRWVLVSEQDEFALSEPGRVRFFLHLIRYNRQYRPLMKFRLHLINYFNAFAGLVVGYKNLPRLNRIREDLTRWTRARLLRTVTQLPTDANPKKSR
jgi:glycosyltransferase involved in cell wall biosynthesis